MYSVFADLAGFGMASGKRRLAGFAKLAADSTISAGSAATSDWTVSAALVGRANPPNGCMVVEIRDNNHVLAAPPAYAEQFDTATFVLLEREASAVREAAIKKLLVAVRASNDSFVHGNSTGTVAAHVH